MLHSLVRIRNPKSQIQIPKSVSPRRRVHFQLVQPLLNRYRGGLHPAEIRVQSVRRHQFLVRPALNDMAGLQYKDLVAGARIKTDHSEVLYSYPTS